MTPPMGEADSEELPKMIEQLNMKSMEETSSFANLEELIHYEEQNVLDLLAVALKVTPNMLGNDGLKKGKSGKNNFL